MVYENVSNLMHTFYEEKTASENVSFFFRYCPLYDYTIVCCICQCSGHA